MSSRQLPLKITLGALIFCGLVFLVYYLGLSRFTNSPLTVALNPAIKSGRDLANYLGDFFSLYSKQKDLADRNELLRQELIALTKKNVELISAKNENELLKKELRFLDEYKYRYVMARVIGQSFDYENNYLIIDKGVRDGLFVGLAVTANQGLLVGRLIKVEQDLSQVQFLTDTKSKIAVSIMGEEEAPGLAIGDHDLNLKIDMLPKLARIAPHNLVVTSNLNINIPHGLLVGEIQKVESSDVDLWQSAVAEPLVDYSKLPFVTVILPDYNN
ncbi:rod shape-determining protein MreC [Candidatus Kuenenbacteria bacterium RIFCSPLOWO2_12_FULL_42_13]|nr:MAG: Cell shape-determining protein MreC [Candidatus Kuenenbacteria bacterium GW2011_GWA2_42_15]OGG89596.1 MAG: rod shape-determining protein MreC [Candidatus Kuenenbacteria bacterium RIFCSPHIGHO2_02_FULL_42_29]OGG90973.1 MAG: rod shape-determining protein MreC [Candidatus Kuenenbacteria bacterium RIFCSPLOWO2_02_FULL_42_16]OGG91260.1 MAG: rod shape-determining protein MreC [Candidatus Kuenenbacteria bacterium RIFCSPLOWO2_12_FULL_42_13]OGG99013.1 MAG: rod shape-determining protein MreC [Candi